MNFLIRTVCSRIYEYFSQLYGLNSSSFTDSIDSSLNFLGIVFLFEFFYVVLFCFRNLYINSENNILIVWKSVGICERLHY